MTVKELAERFDWRLLAGDDGADRPVKGCYIGDLLSWVMSRALADNIWLTVMGNVNAVGVAVLTDVAAIVLVEDAALDEVAKQRADQQGVPIYTCSANAYETATALYEALK